MGKIEIPKTVFEDLALKFIINNWDHPALKDCICFYHAMIKDHSLDVKTETLYTARETISLYGEKFQKEFNETYSTRIFKK